MLSAFPILHNPSIRMNVGIDKGSTDDPESLLEVAASFLELTTGQASPQNRFSKRYG
jgi:hypothetical protein